MKVLLHPSLWGADSLAMTPSQRGPAPELFLLLAEPPFRRPGEKRQSVVRNPSQWSQARGAPKRKCRRVCGTGKLDRPVEDWNVPESKS